RWKHNSRRACADRAAIQCGRKKPANSCSKGRKTLKPLAARETRRVVSLPQPLAHECAPKKSRAAREVQPKPAGGMQRQEIRHQRAVGKIDHHGSSAHVAATAAVIFREYGIRPGIAAICIRDDLRELCGVTNAKVKTLRANGREDMRG